MRIHTHALAALLINALMVCAGVASGHDNGNPNSPIAEPIAGRERGAEVRVAHRGPLDRYGCHYDGSNYHCH